MTRRSIFLLLPLALLLAGCTDHPLPTAAPEGPAFTQSPASPVVNSLLDDGTGCTDAKCTLRDAIAFASAGATITFSVTGEILLRPAGGLLEIHKNLTLSGPGAAILTVSGNNASRVLYVGSGSTASISGLTLTGGNTSSGGGIWNDGTLALVNVTISGNTALWEGGGIVNVGTLTLTNSTVSNNSAAVFGGGIANYGTLTLTHSTVSNNTTPFDGGGIFSLTSGDRITTSTTIQNSTISGNTAGGFGGGVMNENGLTRIVHSTIASNHALGGGVFSSNDGWTRTDVKGSLIWGNTDGGSIPTPRDVAAAETGTRYNSLGYNLIGASGGNVDFDVDFKATGDQTGVGSGSWLSPLADNGGPTRTHALLAGSPAIDAIPFGSEGCAPSTDQRGFLRPQGGACDIGAFEGQPPTLMLGIDGPSAIVKKTGAATLTGTLTCSAPMTVTVTVSLSQQQAAKGKTPATTVSGSGSTSVSCSGSTPWTAEAIPASGKFAAGAATATASAPGASTVTQTVQLMK